MTCKVGRLATLYKKLALRILAALFVLFVLAEVSVLQAYCGNESIGIPSADHLANLDIDTIADSEPQFLVTETEPLCPNGLSSTSDPDSQCHGHAECFGSCSHIVVSAFWVKFKHVPLELPSPRINSYTSGYIPTDLTPLFHPPKSI